MKILLEQDTVAVVQSKNRPSPLSAQYMLRVSASSSFSDVSNSEWAPTSSYAVSWMDQDSEIPHPPVSQMTHVDPDPSSLSRLASPVSRHLLRSMGRYPRHRSQPAMQTIPSSRAVFWSSQSQFRFDCWFRVREVGGGLLLWRMRLMLVGLFRAI